jgi:hypothetical protein
MTERALPRQAVDRSPVGSLRLRMFSDSAAVVSDVDGFRQASRFGAIRPTSCLPSETPLYNKPLQSDKSSRACPTGAAHELVSFGSRTRAAFADGLRPSAILLTSSSRIRR